MSNHIFEEGPRKGHAAGSTSIEQQASQLASDIKYKARQKMRGASGSNMSPGQVQQLYRQLLNSSPAPGGVKAIVKNKLFREQIDTGVVPVSEHVKGSSSYVYSRVFLEAEERKFIVRVTDRETGNTTYRKADRAKISELRANKNISSVEITGRKEVDDAYKGDPKPNYSSGGKKAKKDYDGDGKVESGTAEYMGSKDKAIKKAVAKEEVIYEKEDNGDKKIDVMKKGKNTVKICPSIDENIRAELDLLKAQRIAEQDASMKQQEDEKKKEQLAAQQGKKDKMMKMRILQNKMRAVRGGAEISASHKLEGDIISEGEGQMRYCPYCDKDETRDECKAGGEYWDENSKPAKEEDPRSIPTKINLAKNKLRAMGLKMSYDMEGDQIDERTRYAKETGKDFKTGNPSEEGGTRTGTSAYDKLSANMRKTGGMMSSRGNAISPQGKKKDPGAKGYKGVTPVDKIKHRIGKERASRPNPYRPRVGESD